jgi:LemA protein
MNAAVKILLGLVALFLAIILIAGLWLWSTYNGLVSLRAATDAQWAQVENVYQRRADLIPNLVNTVAGAANFEKSTLIAVTQARASVGRVQLPPGAAPTNPAQLAAFDRAQGQLGGALSRLLVVSERYPTLTATANFRDLQAQLEGTENRIAVERRRFNEVVMAYDVGIQRFPAVLIASIFGYHARPYFSASPGAETVPKVNFGAGAPAPAGS